MTELQLNNESIEYAKELTSDMEFLDALSLARFEGTEVPTIDDYRMKSERFTGEDIAEAYKDGYAAARKELGLCKLDIDSENANGFESYGAHIRNLLTPVRNIIELIRRGGGIPTYITNQASQLETVTNKIFKLSKLELFEKTNWRNTSLFNLEQYDLEA